MHDRVEVPEPMSLVGVRVQMRPVEGDTVEARLTTPAKPLTAVIVTVEVPATPALTVTLVKLVAIVKSCTVKVMVAEWDRLPLVPVTVTVYAPAVPEHDSVEVPDPVKLVGLRVHVKPVAGLTVEVSPTRPLKPSRAVTVIAEGPATPALIVTLDGLADIAKSWMV